MFLRRKGNDRIQRTHFTDGLIGGVTAVCPFDYQRVEGQAPRSPCPGPLSLCNRLPQSPYPGLARPCGGRCPRSLLSRGHLALSAPCAGRWPESPAASPPRWGTAWALRGPRGRPPSPSDTLRRGRGAGPGAGPRQVQRGAGPGAHLHGRGRARGRGRAAPPPAPPRALPARD